jgi:hypothetical protein
VRIERWIGHLSQLARRGARQYRSIGGFATFAAIAADGDQQLCKVLRPAIGRRGQSAVQPLLDDVIRSDVVMPR